MLIGFYKNDANEDIIAQQDSAYIHVFKASKAKFAEQNDMTEKTACNPDSNPINPLRESWLGWLMQTDVSLTASKALWKSGGIGQNRCGNNAKAV